MPRPNKRNREARRLEEALTSQIHSIEVSRQTATIHSGPLPDPDTLAKYEQMMPGLADRIVRMAEKQSGHRQSLETSLLDARITDAKASRQIESRGQHYGLIVALVLIVGGVLAILFDHAVTGSLLSGTTLVSLVGIFIYGRKSKDRDDAKEPPKSRTAAIVSAGKGS